MYKNTLKKSYPQKLCTMWITLSTGGGQLFQERKRQGRKERERRAEKNERKGKVNCLKMRGEYGIIGQKEKKDMTERDLTEEAKAAITGEKKEKLEKFRSLLLEYNQKYNLTSITEEKDVYYKHFLDSAAGAPLFSGHATVAEVGSGAGFPSLVLKILRDDLSFTLFESVGKKCDFLRIVVDNLGLSGMNIMNMRAEDAARDPEFREKFDYCTARAVARMNTLSEYCLPLVKVGGIFLAYKSGDRTETEEARVAFSELGCGEVKIYGYELPEGYGERTLVAVKKRSHTPGKYPRSQGLPRKKPLL